MAFARRMGGAGRAGAGAAGEVRSLEECALVGAGFMIQEKN